MRDKIKNFVARRISWSIIYKAMAYKTFPKFEAHIIYMLKKPA